MSAARSALALFQPGGSVVHRLPAGLKLALLVAAGVGSVFVRSPVPGVVALAVAVALYPVARLPVRQAGAQVWPLRWLLLFTAAFQVLAAGWERAVTVVTVLCALVVLAALVTLTTRTTALVDALVAVCRPLRVVGVDPERVGLLVSLGIRCVPVVVGLAEEVGDAQRARGLTASPRAFAVPLLVRSLRHADHLAEALVARGVDD